MSLRLLLEQIESIIRVEIGLYLRDRRLFFAALAVTLIPAIYIVIFLTSVWDPAGHSDALPVALVNLDRDTSYRDQTFNIGRELADALKTKKTFRFIDDEDPDTARRMVRQGTAVFALVIPDNFSANALPGNEVGAGKIEVFTSEGNSYQAANIARRFAGELSEEMNNRLNERRWRLVLTAATGSEQSVERLRSAAAILKNGSEELLDGSSKINRGSHELRKRTTELDAGVNRLADGSRELGKAMRALDARQPLTEDLEQLQSGSEVLQQGQTALGNGLIELKVGSTRLRNGMIEFRDEAQASVFVPGEAQESARRIVDGLTQLNDGLQETIEAQKKLSEGSAKVNAKLSLLVDGAKGQSVAIHAINTKLPPDAQVDVLKRGSESIASGMAGLADGTEQLNDGAQRLSAGFKLLTDTLPDATPGLEGSAEGLSHSVAPVLVVDAPVPNQGNAYAINMVPAALWLGAGIVIFLINVRVLPQQGASLPPMAQFVSKLALPAALVTLQGIVVILTMIFVLNLSIANFWAVSLTIIIAALTFLIFVLALTRAFGDVGKALAILFLALQLSSSGGVMPVELSGSLYTELSPWLPLTWVVKSLKAGMFGAFEGQWMASLLPVAVAGIVAAWVASRVGRWDFIDEASIRPPLDF